MKTGRISSTFLILGLILLLMELPGCERTTSPTNKKEVFLRLQKDKTLNSQILHQNIKYAVFLPKGYDSTTTTKYPVVYLLHGMGDNESAWYMEGAISYYADANAATSVPMIYVMPQGFNTYWVNQSDGSFPYMDMFINEMVPEIDSKYRTIKDPQHRAVMGYSMGGYGALILPAKNPAVFKTGVVLSMSYRTDQQYMDEAQNGWNIQWGKVFGGVGTTGTARLTDYYKANNPFYFFKKPGDISLSGQNYYFDCGDDEENLSEPNDDLHDLMRDLNIKHEYRVRNGGHSWEYWHSAFPDALKYISYSFNNQPYPDDPDQPDTGPVVPAERIFAEKLSGSEINYSVTVPATYLTDANSYAVILVLHDRSETNQETESQNLRALLSTNMKSVKIPNSLIVEIPLQTATVTADALKNIITQLRSKYRTIADAKHTILIGNRKAGQLAYEFVPKFSGLINACLLFDANLPEDAIAYDSGISYYLDICDEGINYKNYHSLYMSLRHIRINHEYRVRQGTPTHNSFLNGLNESAVYMKNHLSS